MSYPSDLTDSQWDLLEPVFNAPGQRGLKLMKSFDFTTDSATVSQPRPTRTPPSDRRKVRL